MEQQNETTLTTNFNFDSDEHKVSIKTPSAKAIGGGLKLKGGAGLWIAKENLDACNWRKHCNEDCPSTCINHHQGLMVHNISTKRVDDLGEEITIPGGIVVEPRLLIIGVSPLLKIDTESGYVKGLWVKGDGLLKAANGAKLYSCVRRYNIIFVDSNNNPMHDVDRPIQLTAKGYFQMEFDRKFKAFKTAMVSAYNEANHKNYNSMNDAWYSMCVYAPLFKSEMRGPSKDKQSRACITVGFEVPSKDDWETLCIGRAGNLTQQVYKSHKTNCDWWKKAIQKTSSASSSSSSTEEVPIESFDDLCL